MLAKKIVETWQILAVAGSGASSYSFTKMTKDGSLQDASTLKKANNADKFFLTIPCLVVCCGSLYSLCIQ